MNKDLRKVVILLAHPNIKESQANKALVDAVSDMEGVAVFNLYELSQEIVFNIDEWSKIISDASAVIYQFPFYWMSAPSLLKKWHHGLRIRGLSQWRQKPFHYGRIITSLSGKCHSFGNVMANPYCCLWDGNGRRRQEYR